MNKKVALSLLSATVFASMTASAFAAPNPGVYMGGDVDKYYALTDLFKLNDAGFAKFQSDLAQTKFENLIFVDHDGKGATLKEILSSTKDFEETKRDLKQSDFEGVYAKANLDGTNGESYDPRKDITPEPTGELKVESVTAVNANEIKVSFSKELDKNTAETVANYTPTIAGGLTVADAKLQADKKTVILQLSGPMANGITYKIDVAGVKDSEYNTIKPVTGEIKVFADTTAPTLLSAEYVKGAVKLTFDEPVSNTMVVKVDNAVVADGVVTQVVPATTAGDYSVVTPAIALSAGSHTVTVYNAADTVVGSPNVTPLASKSFSVTTDTVPPTVTSVTAATSNTFKIKFSEPLKEVTPGTPLPNIDALVATDNLVVKKGALNLKGRITTTLDATDSSNTTYIVTITAADPVNPLYGTGETSVSLSVSVKGYQDNADLFGPAFNGNVTLTTDTVGPAVVSAKLNSVDDQGAGNDLLLVKFNEALDPTKLSQTKVKVKVDGIVQTIAATPLAVYAGDATGETLAIDLGGDVLQSKVYTVELAAGAVSDLAGNGNTALTTTVDNTAAAGDLVITTTEATVIAPNIINIAYGEAMAPSAAVLSNYKLDGNAFPAGTTIDFVGNDQTVQITLPTGIFDVDTSGLLSISTSVTNKDGSKVVRTADKKENKVLLSFTDNVKPVLEAAKFVLAAPSDTSTNAIKLSFSEGLAAITADTADNMDDFIVLVDGVEVAVAHLSDGTGNNVASGAKELVIATATPFNINQKVEVQVVPVGTKNTAVDTTDDAVPANTLTTGTTVTVSK